MKERRARSKLLDTARGHKSPSYLAGPVGPDVQTGNSEELDVRAEVTLTKGLGCEPYINNTLLQPNEVTHPHKLCPLASKES